MVKRSYPLRPVMLVDDEPQVLIAFSTELRLGGITNVVTCQDPRQVLPLLEEHDPEVLLLDLIMPHMHGKDLLPEVLGIRPQLPVIIVTAVSDIGTAVECIKSGAYDYLPKPMEDGRLVTSVRRAIAHREMQRELYSLKERVMTGRLDHSEAFSAIVTRNKTMFSIFQYVESIAGSTQPLLVTGETGVGKELVARAAHRVSGCGGDFVKVNVAGLDDNMFADTLFGHARGAFTGAEEARPGLVVKAAGGTLFLDEIGDLSQASQVKLLNLLQDREFLPLGQDMPEMTDARVIVATHHDLLQDCNNDRFRRDLFYRLQTHHVHLPPLRERMDDLPYLIDHFLKDASTSLNKKTPAVPKELYQLLAAYHFPGNVRELEAMIFDAVSTHDSGVLSLASFRSKIRETASVSPGIQGKAQPEKPLFSDFEMLPSLLQAGEALVEEALRRSEGNLSAAADILGISRQALSKRLKRHMK